METTTRLIFPRFFLGHDDSQDHMTWGTMEVCQSHSKWFEEPRGRWDPYYKIDFLKISDLRNPSGFQEYELYVHDPKQPCFQRSNYLS